MERFIRVLLSLTDDYTGDRRYWMVVSLKSWYYYWNQKNPAAISNLSERMLFYQLFCLSKQLDGIYSKHQRHICEDIKNSQQAFQDFNEEIYRFIEEESP